jgi:hypothetical protein
MEWFAPDLHAIPRVDPILRPPRHGLVHSTPAIGADLDHCLETILANCAGAAFAGTATCQFGSFVASFENESHDYREQESAGVFGGLALKLLFQFGEERHSALLGVL